MLSDAQSREQLTAELAALRHRVAVMQSQPSQPASAGAATPMVVLALDAADVGLVGLDPAGKVVFANLAACRLVGLSSDDAVGRPHAEVMPQVQADGTPLPEGRGAVDAALAHGVTHRLDRAYLRRRDGVEVPTRLVVTPVAEGGRTTGAVVSLQDLRNASAGRFAEDRRLTEFEAMVRISETLVLPGDLQEQAGKILDGLMTLTEADRATLLVPDVDGLRVVGSAGLGADSLSTDEIPFGVGLSGQVYQRGEELLEGDYPNNPHANPGVVALGVRSLAAAPVVVEGRVSGVVTLSSTQRNHFTPARVRLLNATVDSVGVLMEKVRLQAEEKRRTREVEGLFAIAEALAQPFEHGEKFRRILDEALSATQSHSMGLALPSSDDALAISQVVGLAITPGAEVLTLPRRTGMAGIAFSQGTTVVVKDYPAYPAALRVLVEEGTKSAVALPLRADGETLGVLVAAAPEFDHYTPDRVRFLTAVAEAISAQLSKSRVDERMLSELDTGGSRRFRPPPRGSPWRTTRTRPCTTSSTWPVASSVPG